MTRSKSELISTLRENRQNEGITQADLADAIGVSRKTINTIENGIYTPSTILALKLARHFRLRVEDLFRLPDEK